LHVYRADLVVAHDSPRLLDARPSFVVGDGLHPIRHRTQIANRFRHRRGLREGCRGRYAEKRPASHPHCPTTSKCFSLPVGKITVSLCTPPMVAGRPFTVALFTAFAAGMRSFTCNSLGEAFRAKSTVATTLFDDVRFARLKF